METVEASDFIFKVIAVGEASVGKTSLTLRYATNSFSDDYRMTLGLNLTNKNVALNYKDEDIVVQLSIWDTGGQVSFAPLLPMYYKGALGALIVYDLTNRKSFEQVDAWVDDVKKHCSQIPLVIMANKKDLEDEIIVSTEEGRKKADEIQARWENSVYFFETSAKEDVKVNESFSSLARCILEIVYESDEVEEPDFGLIND